MSKVDVSFLLPRENIAEYYEWKKEYIGDCPTSTIGDVDGWHITLRIEEKLATLVALKYGIDRKRW